MMNKKPTDYIFYALIIGATLLITFLAVLANKVFMFQPYAYMVDEISDLQILNKFYSISSFSDFTNLFFKDNPEHYHGFITYLIPAAISYIPFKLGGEPYLIFTFRMSSALFIISSYLIMTFTFFKKSYQRFFFYVILLLLPFTNMFIIWPRCESYQYFFFALFLFFMKKKSASKTWPFILLGLAMASRISMAPYIGILIPFFYLLIYKKSEKSFLKTSKASLLVIFGFLLGQPHLFVPANIRQWLGSKYMQVFNDTGMDPSFGFSGWLETAVPLYTGHSNLLFVIIGLFFIVFLVSLKEARQMNEQRQYSLFMALTLGATGLISLLAVMYKVKIIQSYWYLQQHYMFLLLGTLVPLSLLKNNKLQWINNSLLTLFFIMSLTLGLEQSPLFVSHPWGFKEKINRHKEPDNIENERNYQAVVKAMENFSQRSNKKITFRVLADLWQPRSTDLYSIQPEWYPSPFIRFGDGVEKEVDAIIVNQKLYFPPERILENMQEGEREIREQGYKLYKKYACSSALGDSQEPHCFEKIDINENYLLFFKRSLLKPGLNDSTTIQ